MDIRDILSKVDHTVLSQTATWDDIRALCDDGMRYGTSAGIDRDFRLIVQYDDGSSASLDRGDVTLL